MGVWLDEEGEDVGPNMLIKGDSLWKCVGEVGNAGRREVRRGDGKGLGRCVELDGTGRRDVGRWKVELDDG